MITVTENAKNELFRLINKVNDRNKALTILFKGFNWGCPVIDIALEKPNGCNIIFCNESLTFMTDRYTRDIIQTYGGLNIGLVKRFILKDEFKLVLNKYSYSNKECYKQFKKKIA